MSNRNNLMLLTNTAFDADLGRPSKTVVPLDRIMYMDETMFAAHVDEDGKEEIIRGTKLMISGGQVPVMFDVRESLETVLAMMGDRASIILAGGGSNWRSAFRGNPTKKQDLDAVNKSKSVSGLAEGYVFDAHEPRHGDMGHPDNGR